MIEKNSDKSCIELNKSLTRSSLVVQPMLTLDGMTVNMKQHVESDNKVAILSFKILNQR